MVVESHTLMSSCVEKRDTSDLDRRTAKIGNRTSLQIVSQNSAGKLEPCRLSVSNR